MVSIAKTSVCDRHNRRAEAWVEVLEAEINDGNVARAGSARVCLLGGCFPEN